MDELKKLNQKISDEIAGAREAGIRDTLVALGWVPPKESGQQSDRIRELEECRQCLYDALDLFRYMEEKGDLYLGDIEENGYNRDVLNQIREASEKFIKDHEHHCDSLRNAKQEG